MGGSAPLFFTFMNNTSLGIRQDNNGNYYFGQDGKPSTYQIPDGVTTDYLGSLRGDNVANYILQTQTNKENRLLAEQQNQWNIEQWNRENEYNEPSKQMQRLLDAGVNPVLASGQVSTGNANSITSANLANQVAPQIDPNVGTNKINAMNGAISNVLGSAKQLMDYQLQAKQLDIQNRSLDIQENDLKSQQLLRAAQTKGQNITNANAQRQFDDASKVANASIDKMNKEGELTDEQANQIRELLPMMKDKSLKEIEQLREAIINLQKQGRNIDANTALVHAEMEGIGYDNIYKKFVAECADKGWDIKGKWSDNLIKMAISDPKNFLQVVDSYIGAFKDLLNGDDPNNDSPNIMSGFNKMRGFLGTMKNNPTMAPMMLQMYLTAMFNDFFNKHSNNNP